MEREAMRYFTTDDAAYEAATQQLNDELSSDKVIRLKADAGEQFVENLEIPNYGDTWIPGYRVITEQLAREMGLRGYEGDPLPDFEPDEPQPATGAVNGNILEAFIDGVTGQQKNDVLNSTLLAQLAANTKVPNKGRIYRPVDWTYAYSTILMNIAWVVPSYRFTAISTRAREFTMDQAVLKLIESFLNPTEMETVKLVIDAVKALESEDRRLRIWQRNSREFRDGNFQCNGVGLTRDGTVTMKLGAYSFKAESEVTDILWFRYKGNTTKMQFAKSTFVLNEEVYSRLREPILTKLGDSGIRFIGGLTLTEE